MQNVSKEYRTGMKNSLRERSYMMISFGLVNQEAQANATVAEGEFSYYTNNKSIFGQKDGSTIYATLEQDFTKVDGSMFFLPRQNSSGSYLDTGLVSGPLIPDTGYELLIELNVVPTDIKGLTINFGEIYPTRFDIMTSSGQKIEVTGNEKSIFSTEEVLENTTEIRLVFYEMKNHFSRLRIYSIQLGYGLVYHNKDILDSSLETYISPISDDVSQIDFMVKLQNYDQYFNVDNPNSAINFLETGQEMTIYYGLYIKEKDSIEWIKGGQLLCSEWENDDYSATIRCQDIFRTMDSEYYKGEYREEGITLYDHAVLVFEDAGIEKYYIDPYLKKIKTRNPMPRVTHREALQIIANAGRCVLSQNRDGCPQIQSSFLPDFTVSCNGETEYSNIENIKKSDPKVEYAAFSHNYTLADGSNQHLPKDFSEAAVMTGYILEFQSNEEGLFQTNPVITIVQESECMYYGFKIVFGNALPAEFVVRTFNAGTAISEYVITSEKINKNCIIKTDLPNFDTMEIEFTKTAEPYNRIVIDYFSFGDVTDFTMERKDMTSSPKSIKQELVKNVEVSCFFYNKATAIDTLISEEAEVLTGDIRIYYMGEATYGLQATFNNSANNVEIVSCGAYYCEIKFKLSGKYKLEITGYRYNIAMQTITQELNSRGKTIQWENPLIGDTETAKDLAVWLGDYYNAGIEYEYTTRGNPEIDANDIIFQENTYRPGLKVNIYRHTVNFSTSLSGKVSARRSIMTMPKSKEVL